MRNAFLIVGLLLLAPLAAAAQSTWGTYTSVRYAFAVDYPRDIFPAFQESDNSDGATFESKQPGVELRAFGFLNIDRLSPKATVAERYKSKALTYTSVKRESFVVSGEDGGAIFYDRCNFAGDRVVCVNIVYPAAQNAAWDKVVGRMSRSLRVVGALGR